MKKALIYLFLVVMSIIMVGCAGGNNGASNNQDQAHTLSGLEKMPQFKCQDMYEKEVTNHIFVDQKLTLINIWATTCAPCVDELPELQALYTEMQEQKVNIMGVVADGSGKESAARQILQQQGADYINIIPNDKFMADFVTRTDRVPVSIMVNSQGQRVGEIIVGTRTKDAYKKIIETTLEEMK